MLDEVVPPMHMETLWKEAKERCSNYKQEDTERLSDTPTDEDLALLVKFPTGAHSKLSVTRSPTCVTQLAQIQPVTSVDINVLCKNSWIAMLLAHSSERSRPF